MGQAWKCCPFFQLGRWHLNLKPISGAFCFLFFVDKVMYSHDINCFIVLFLFRHITSILKLFTAPRHLAKDSSTSPDLLLVDALGDLSLKSFVAN
jgi:hypothetical protein